MSRLHEGSAKHHHHGGGGMRSIFFILMRLGHGRRRVKRKLSMRKLERQLRAGLERDRRWQFDHPKTPRPIVPKKRRR